MSKNSESMEFVVGKGDDGTTDLGFGNRVLKSTDSVFLLCMIDKCVVYISDITRVSSDLQYHRCPYILWKKIITKGFEFVRKIPDTFHVASSIVSNYTKYNVSNDKFSLTEMDGFIKDVNEDFPKITQFILPSQTKLASKIDKARVIVRETEIILRRYMEDNNKTEDEFYIKFSAYMNRLSRFLFSLSYTCLYVQKKDIEPLSFTKTSVFK